MEKTMTASWIDVHRRPAARGLAAVLFVPAIVFFAVPAAADSIRDPEKSTPIFTFFLFVLPSTLTMIGLIVASVIRLVRKRAPGPRAGRVALALSLASFACCLGLMLYCVSLAGWKGPYAIFPLVSHAPGVLFTLASAILAWLLRRRARASG